MNEDYLEYKLKGYCCSQIVTEITLKKLGKENPDMVKAMAGLCTGGNHGGDCGILSAANCMLYLVNPALADLELSRDLNEWFEGSFGSMSCEALLEGNPLNKVEKCPGMIMATMDKLAELLEWD